MARCPKVAGWARTTSVVKSLRSRAIAAASAAGHGSTPGVETDSIAVRTARERMTSLLPSTDHAGMGMPPDSTPWETSQSR